MKQHRSDDAYGRAAWNQSRHKSGPYARSDNIDKEKSESWTRDESRGEPWWTPALGSFRRGEVCALRVQPTLTLTLP